MKEISTSDLQQQLAHPNHHLIDVRPVDVYNGWRPTQSQRRGHISGARSIPAKWADYMDWIEIVRNKGIQSADTITVYGDKTDEVAKVAALFVRTKHRKVQTYPHFAAEWASKEELPMTHLSRYRQLVSPDWLKELLDTGNAPEFENDKFVLCHSHYRNPAAYDEGHIPGAVELDTNTLESPETWNRRSPEELQATLESLGISSHTTVVLYGRFAFPNNEDPFPGSAAGHLGAIRSAFIMMYAGVKDVRVLNGGLQSWTDSGYEITTEPFAKNPVSSFGAPIPGNPHLAVDTPEAKEILADADKNLVSVRSWPEFIGEVSGYNYIKKKGRIPGAVFGNCGSDAYHMENYRNLDHTIREFGEVEKQLAEVGVTRDKMNAFYCGTGWRGAEAWFNAWLMGWSQVAVYDGGWFEWSNNPENPYETGVPQKYRQRRTGND